MDFPLKPKSGVATVKLRNIAPLPAVLRELGADPDSVLQKVGVNPGIFANLDSVISYAAAGRLFAACVEATGCDDFGLRVGVRSGPPAMGLTGLVSVNSPTVREGLRVLIGTLETSDTGGVVLLDIYGGVASLGYSVVAPQIEAVGQIEDTAIAMGINIMRGLCGAGWGPRAVRLTRKPPRDRSLYASFFGAPVQFEAVRSCMEFDSALLSAPVIARDPGYVDVLTPLLEEAVANARPDFLSSVRATVRAQLTSGTLSRDSVCRALSLNPRTLAHRLGGAGVTYSGLADEARYDLARSLLLKDRPLAEIAAALGFAEQSAFTRAFKAWSGTTPARWRAEIR